MLVPGIVIEELLLASEGSLSSERRDSQCPEL